MIAHCRNQLWLVSADQELSGALGSWMDLHVLENKTWKGGGAQVRPQPDQL